MTTSTRNYQKTPDHPKSGPRLSEADRIELVRGLFEEVGNQICLVVFYKRDGSTRKLFGRPLPEPEGDAVAGMPYIPSDHDLVMMLDIEIDEPRNVPLARVESIITKDWRWERNKV